MKESDDLFTM